MLKLTLVIAMAVGCDGDRWQCQECGDKNKKGDCKAIRKLLRLKARVFVKMAGACCSGKLE